MTVATFKQTHIHLFSLLLVSCKKITPSTQIMQIVHARSVIGSCSANPAPPRASPARDGRRKPEASRACWRALSVCEGKFTWLYLMETRQQGESVSGKPFIYGSVLKLEEEASLCWSLWIWASHVTALMLEEWMVFNLEILLKSQQQWRSKNMEPDSGFKCSLCF